MTDYDAILPSPVGRLGVVMDRQGRLVALDFLDGRTRLSAPTGSAARGVAEALEGYFADPRVALAVPLAPAATVFQRAIRRALLAIPPGRTRSYGAIAKQLNSAPRAVGQACRRNPIPILVPCHRVVALSGSGGYSGATDGAALAIKHWLLAHEGVAIVP